MVDIEELQNRVNAYSLLELPGQPMMVHMGTSHLINDLMSAVKELAEEIEPVD